jgi:hypothetical protein
LIRPIVNLISIFIPLQASRQKGLDKYIQRGNNLVK